MYVQPYPMSCRVYIVFSEACFFYDITCQGIDRCSFHTGTCFGNGIVMCFEYGIVCFLYLFFAKYLRSLEGKTLVCKYRTCPVGTVAFVFESGIDQKQVPFFKLSLCRCSMRFRSIGIECYDRIETQIILSVISKDTLCHIGQRILVFTEAFFIEYPVQLFEGFCTQSGCFCDDLQLFITLDNTFFMRKVRYMYELDLRL